MGIPESCFSEVSFLNSSYLLSVLVTLDAATIEAAGKGDSQSQASIHLSALTH